MPPHGDTGRRRGRVVLRLLLVNAIGLSAVLAGAELLLRRIDPPAAIPYTIHPSDTSITVKVDPRVTYGVRGDALFETNAFGMRGRLPAAADRLRIVALGGSTTECFVLSLEESWPWRLENLLSRGLGGGVWVGNAGRAGRNSRQHYFDAKYVVPALGRVDVALLMVGINDLFNRMIQGERFDRVDVVALDAGGDYIRTALEASGSGGGWLGGLRLAARGRRALEALALLSPRERAIRRALNHALPDFYVSARAMRAAGRPVDTPPPMDEALAEFERNLSLTIDRLQANGTVPILITQPALWRDDLSEEERDALWLGSADGWPPNAEGGPYYTVRVMAQLLDRYNGLLRDLARRRNLEVIDLATLMRPGLDTCYDDVHFNEAGSARVAEILAERLIATAAVEGLSDATAVSARRP
jgi:lysophospholipase L1-like esterase